MDFHRGPHTQAALEAVEVVIGDVLLDHLDQLLPAGEPPAIVALPLEDAPEALHGHSGQFRFLRKQGFQRR